jgi:hypothetical protein
MIDLGEQIDKRDSNTVSALWVSVERSVVL